MLSKYRKINSNEDGDCAFNVMVLALSDQTFAGNLDKIANTGQYANFLKRCAETLKITNDWSSFKTFLQTHKDNPKYLQKALAPILRDLVSNRKHAAHEQAQHIEEGDIAAFLAEFRHHLNTTLSIQAFSEGGDIYSKHVFIISQYREYAENIKNALEFKKVSLAELRAARAMQTEEPSLLKPSQLDIIESFETILAEHMPPLVEWFKTQGYKTFLQKMQQQGQWAGDKELAEFAQEFGIDVKCINSNQYNYTILADHGHLDERALEIAANAAPILKDSIIKILIDRGIVDKEKVSNRHILKELTEQELNQKLDEVPDSNDIFDDWFQQENAPVKILSATLAKRPQLVACLVDRGITYQDPKSEAYLYYSDLNIEKLLSKLQAIDHKETIQNLWKSNYQQRPCITLSNPEALHWYYLQPTAMNNWDLSALDISNAPQQAPDLLMKFLSANSSLLKNWQGPSQDLQTNTNQSTINSYDSMLTMLPPLPSVDYTQTEIIVSSDDEQEKNSGLLSLMFPDNALFNNQNVTNSNGFSDFLVSDEHDTPAFNSSQNFFNPLRRSNPFQDESIPPSKKAKTAVSALKNEASAIKTILTELKTDNKIVQELINAYDFSAATGEIGSTHFCLLSSPEKYAKLKGIELNLNLPKEVASFAQKFQCQILLQAKNTLFMEFNAKHFWLILNLKDTTDANKALDFINRLYNQIQSGNIPAIKNELVSFNFDEIDQLIPLLKNPCAENLAVINEIRKFLAAYVPVFEIAKPESCATSILNLMTAENTALNKYKNIFTIIKQYGFDEKIPGVNELLEFHADLLSDDTALGKAIEAFVRIYMTQLALIPNNNELQFG